MSFNLQYITGAQDQILTLLEPTGVLLAKPEQRPVPRSEIVSRLSRLQMQSPLEGLQLKLGNRKNLPCHGRGMEPCLHCQW